LHKVGAVISCIIRSRSNSKTYKKNTEMREELDNSTTNDFQLLLEKYGELGTY